MNRATFCGPPSARLGEWVTANGTGGLIDAEHYESSSSNNRSGIEPISVNPKSSKI
jgi:hypothetical protein